MIPQQIVNDFCNFSSNNSIILTNTKIQTSLYMSKLKEIMVLV